MLSQDEGGSSFREQFVSYLDQATSHAEDGNYDDMTHALNSAIYHGQQHNIMTPTLEVVFDEARISAHSTLIEQKIGSLETTARAGQALGISAAITGVKETATKLGIILTPSIEEHLNTAETVCYQNALKRRLEAAKYAAKESQGTYGIELLINNAIRYAEFLGKNIDEEVADIRDMISE